MPRQTSSRSTQRTTPAPTNRGRKPNGRRTTANGNGGNGKPNGAWPISLVLAAEVELAIEGEDTTVDGFAVCTRCAAVLPGSEISRALHARFHELVDGIDQRGGVMATQPILSIVRMVPWGSCGYRYVIAAGIGHPLLFQAVFRDTCDVFPDHPVIVVAEYANHCEVVAAHRCTALRPVVQGW